MKKALNTLVDNGFDAVIAGTGTFKHILVKDVRSGINEELYFARNGGIATDLVKGDEMCGSRNFSDLEEYIATA